MKIEFESASREVVSHIEDDIHEFLYNCLGISNAYYTDESMLCDFLGYEYCPMKEVNKKVKTFYNKDVILNKFDYLHEIIDRLK